MESDDAVQDLQFDSSTDAEAKLGPQKSSSQNLLKPRAKKMDGEEKKSELKKRLKPVEICIDSDDDEPIGSFFKLKKTKNPKKVKAMPDGDKGLKVEIREENLVVEDEGLVGMNDTLASFRKKLKGPKKDSRSGILKGRSFSLSGSFENDDILDDKLASGNVEKVQDLGEDASDMTVGKGVEAKCRGRVKRPKMDSKIKTAGAHFMCYDDSKGMGSLADSLEDQKEEELWPVEVSNLSLDEKTVDSLSAFFQRTQSGLIRKSHMNSGLKQNGRDQSVDKGCSPSSGGDFNYMNSSLCASAIKVRQKNSKFNDSSHPVSDFGKLELTSNRDKKIKPMADASGLNVQEEPILDTYSNKVYDSIGNKDTCADVDDGSGLIQKASSETQSLKVRLKLCSMDKASTLVPDDQEMPISASSPDQMGKFCKFEGDCNRGFSHALRQHSRNASAIDNLRSDHEVSSMSIGKEVSVACVDDELTNKSFKTKFLKMSTTGSDPNTCIEEAGFAAISLKEENVVVSNGSLSPTTEMSCRHQESGFTLQKCSPRFHQDQPSDASKGICVPGHDPLSIGEEASRVSPPGTPDENESSPEDAVSMLDSENKDNKLSAVQRAARIAKKCRHGDMAYEGDHDWENLMNDQGFLESQEVVDYDRSLRGRDKFEFSSNTLADAEYGGALAVSVGLKARAAGPIEKIKFKEVFKRRGGLQEYLECRNRILSLWSKDVNRILPITECGVTGTPSEDDPPSASLIREVYTFLDQSGYINVGIASKKEKANHLVKHGYNLCKEEKLEGSSGASVADSVDEVAFILGQVKGSETYVEAKNCVISNDWNHILEVKKGSLFIPEAPNVREDKVCPADDCLQNVSAESPDRSVDVDVLRADPSCKMVDSGKDPMVIKADNDSHSVQSASHSDAGGYQHVLSDSEIRKKIIVVGAGPAGLTAARHLQRQGFSVIILEARHRIGGRVYTDHKSLSVPVDLGASIITGVEADVATERRPDPSSLICAQLGLELTVLNSDCPLYDIVSGQKVPADLDEALEAEYNCLLDDMVLLVAQKGEHAMKMSLEEGLEYALKRRRMARLGRDFEEIFLHNLMDACAKTSSVDIKVPNRNCSEEETLSPLERRVMDWHFAHLEYGCATLLKEVSLPFWNQDDVYGGFGGAHCMIKGGYSAVVESLGEELLIHLNHVVTDISYSLKDSEVSDSQSKVKVTTADGSEFSGDAVLITVPLGCLKAESIKFFPPLPQWKSLAIQRLGFGVLNKVVLEFSEVFWDDTVDYFGATAEETDLRGRCFMFWNVRKTVGAPVLIALVVGKAAIDGYNMSSSDHVKHAVQVLRKIFGEASVPDPVASVVTDWGRDPFSYGAYSYVAIGASGEDYDILGRPVENCLFFAGEATCKEHPDTVGGAMLSGLREAVRIIDILTTGNDYTAEVEAMEAAQRQSESEGDEVMDITRRLEAVELSNVLYKSSLDRALISTRESLLQDMFFNTKTTAGRLHLAKELLNLPVSALKSFAGTKEGLTMLNSWILDSMGKDGTQLLRHCVRLLVRVSTDLLAVRLSGIGKTVKEKVCVHTSRDIRAIASQLVNVWLEVFQKGKTSSGALKFSRQSNAVDSSKRKSLKDPALGKPPLHSHHSGLENKGSSGSHLISGSNMRRENGRLDTEMEDRIFAMSEEEKAAFAAAEAARAAAEAAARAAAEAAAKAFASSGPQLPKIPSFHKFARREQYGQMDEFDLRRKWSGGVLGRQDCILEIDSRNCRVRDWSVDFSAACVNLDNSRTADNLSQRSHSNEIACQLNSREHSGESASAADISIFTKAWVDTAGSVGIKDYHAIERWQSQAAAADSYFFHPAVHVKDEEDSNASSKAHIWKHDRRANGSSVSQVTIKNESLENRPRGADHIKQAVVDYVASLLMPLYKARKIDRDGYKTIMKKSATKVMEQATDAEKNMAVSEFLDFKRKNKIRSFVDILIERHMAMKSAVKS